MPHSVTTLDKFFLSMLRCRHHLPICSGASAPAILGTLRAQRSALCESSPRASYNKRQWQLFLRTRFSSTSKGQLVGDWCFGRVSFAGDFCDASRADEHFKRTCEPHRSPGGRMTPLASRRGLVDQTDCGFRVIGCASNTLRRVCRSKVTAKTYQTSWALKTQITVVDMCTA